MDSYIRFTSQYNGLYYLEASSTDEDHSGIGWLHYRDLTNATPQDAITWEDAAVTRDPIRVHFAPRGQTLNDEGRLYTSDGFRSDEIDRFEEIFDHIETFTDLRFRIVTDPDRAHFKFALADVDSGSLGFMNPQGSTIYSDGVAILDNGSEWSRQSLAKGGLMNHIVAHEIGHGLGLAHPHDGGGFSSNFLGVRDSRDLGDGGLNQVPFTAMTYNDYWDTPGEGEPNAPSTGHLFGFGPLDIAVLQARYGTGDGHNEGDTVYRLGVSPWIETIWDTGGHDSIVYTGNRSTRVSLAAPEIDYDTDADELVSFVRKHPSGFVLAQGVVIEDVTTGRGSDYVFGNTVANKIVSNQGRDTLLGQAGADTLIGGSGRDELFGGPGQDTLRGGSGSDTLSGDRANDHLSGGAGDDELRGDEGFDTLLGGARHDTLIGGSGNDDLNGGTGRDFLEGGPGFDRLFGGGDADVFAFSYGDGRDTIDGFHDDDLIAINARPGTRKGDITFTRSADDGRIVITFDDVTITLINATTEVTRADIQMGF